MQMMNVFAPITANQSSATSGVVASEKDRENDLFQSMLEKSGNAKKGAGLPSTLSRMSKEDQMKHLVEQLKDGVEIDDLTATFREKGLSLDDLFTDLDADALKDLLHSFPQLVDSHPEWLHLLEEATQTEGVDKDQALLALKAVLKDFWLALQGDQTNLENNTIQLITSSISEINAENLKTAMQDVLKSIQQLLESYQSEGKLMKADASKLTALLKQWAQLMRQATDTEVNPGKVQHQMLEEDESDWLDRLMQRLDKRSFYAGKNMYAQNAHVSRQDVMKWLQQAVENQGQPIPHAPHSMSNEQNMPMPKVEQYIVHLEHTGKVERVGADMVSKFSEAIRESQFLKSNGKLELNMMLRPAHLGNVTVKMTHVDGEMMVKILVSSQAAKEMLEQNMHQLRHLFSPHQLSVERNEAVSDDEFYFNDQEEQHEQEDQQAAEENNKNKQQQNHNSPEIDFEEVFHQLSEEVIL